MKDNSKHDNILNLQEVKKMNIDDKMIEALITLREGEAINEQEFLVKLKNLLHFETTKHAISKLRFSDSPRVHGMKHWTNEEVSKLMEMKNAGVTTNKIAIALNRTYTSIDRKIWKLRQSEGLTNFENKGKWTQQELDTLMTLKLEGKKPKEIALTLNRKPYIISQKLHQIKVQRLQNGNI